jgi:hypothetical protein
VRISYIAKIAEIFTVSFIRDPSNAVEVYRMIGTVPFYS